MRNNRSKFRNYFQGLSLIDGCMRGFVGAGLVEERPKLFPELLPPGFLCAPRRNFVLVGNLFVSQYVSFKTPPGYDYNDLAPESDDSHPAK